MVTVKDLLAKGGKSGKPKKLSGSQVEASMAHVWRETLGEVTGKFVPPLTAKAQGQLKMVAKMCPEGQSTEILDRILREWVLFADRVKSTSGIKTVPSEPNINFLLAHAAEAVTYCQQEEEQAHVPEAAQSVVWVPPVSHVVKPMSQEEFAKIMAEDDDDDLDDH